MSDLTKITSNLAPPINSSVNCAVSKVLLPKTSEISNEILNKAAQNPLTASIGQSMVKKRVLGLFDLSSPLPFENKTMQKFDEISPEKLLLVHLTDFLPKKGIINTTYQASGFPRNTLHFALNHAVINPAPNMHQGWENKPYAIFVPFKKISFDSMIGGKYNDFMLEGSLKLPDGSFIYRQNPDIQQGKVLFSDASDFLGASRGTTLIEANEPVYDMADLLVEKLGYTNLKRMHAKHVGLDMNTVNLLNDARLTKTAPFEGKTSAEALCERLGIPFKENEELEKQWGDIWNKFAKSLHVSDTIHDASNYRKLEEVFETVEILESGEFDWSKKLTSDMDCRAFLLSVLDEILQSQDKIPSFVDIKKLRGIIEKSSSPKDAIKQIQEKLNIEKLGVSSTVKPVSFEFDGEIIELGQDELLEMGLFAKYLSLSSKDIAVKNSNFWNY